MWTNQLFVILADCFARWNFICCIPLTTGSKNVLTLRSQWPSNSTIISSKMSFYDSLLKKNSSCRPSILFLQHLKCTDEEKKVKNLICPARIDIKIIFFIIHDCVIIKIAWNWIYENLTKMIKAFSNFKVIWNRNYFRHSISVRGHFFVLMWQPIGAEVPGFVPMTLRFPTHSWTLNLKNDLFYTKNEK